MLHRHLQLALAAALPIGGHALAQGTITERSVAAHEYFLASDALQGRGSATRDEAIAAAYVASRFQAYGLRPAPGMTGYLQTATVIRERLTAAPLLTIGGVAVQTPTLLESSGESISGTLTVSAEPNPARLPDAEIVLASSKSTDPVLFARGLSGRHVKLLIIRESYTTRDLLRMLGGSPQLPSFLDGRAPHERPTVVALPNAVVDALATEKEGAHVELKLSIAQEPSTTTNAIGYLRGTDAAAGALLLSAHLDHLGRLPDGTIMHGANDDASGTTAVLELAEAFANGPRPRRSIIFACFGSEELGEYGATYFAEHSPVPLSQIVADLELEMIGAHDPKLPPNALMLSGFERSNLGPALNQHGALLAADPYPAQHFFQRSDNYAFDLKGVVAHMVSGWAMTPTYHQPTDTYANLDIRFMTNAIRSLIGPVEWLANSDFVPAWSRGGKP